MKAYTVKYKMNFSSEPKSIMVPAKSKYEAYDKAYYEMIPELELYSPYSAWVDSVTYNNGKYKVFNNFEGNAY